jgi:hypothetical protein
MHEVTAVIELLISDLKRLKDVRVTSVFVLHVPPGSPLSGAHGGDGFGRAVTLELAAHILQVLWRTSPRVGDLLAVMCSIRNDRSTRNLPGMARSWRARLIPYGGSVVKGLA